MTYDRYPVAISALHYLTVAQSWESGMRLDRGLWVPLSAHFPIPCLAVSIGRVAEQSVTAIREAPWFAHLRGTCRGPNHVESPHAALMAADEPPRVASIALPARPTLEELKHAHAFGNELRAVGAFVVVTTAGRVGSVLENVGPACDCVILGDGSAWHHTYPARTVVEPPGARLACYDLFDVCSLWAGRIGEFGALHPSAEALHVECAMPVPTLAEVDALVTAFAARLIEPSRLGLYSSVSDPSETRATPISFTCSRAIQQTHVRVSRYNQAGYSEENS